MTTEFFKTDTEKFTPKDFEHQQKMLLGISGISLVVFILTFFVPLVVHLIHKPYVPSIGLYYIGIFSLLICVFSSMWFCLTLESDDEDGLDLIDEEL